MIKHEYIFDEILLEIDNLLTDEEKVYISDYVHKHGEYGIALEEIAFITTTGNVSDSVIQKIKTLANLMAMDDIISVLLDK